MFRLTSENLFKFVSIGSAVLLLFVVGMVIGYFRWGPAKLVGVSADVVSDLKRNSRAYFSDVPVQHLRPSRFAEGGVKVADLGKVQPGVTFVTGLCGQKLGARLYAADGSLIHEWPVNFFTIAADEMAYPYDALIHGDIMFENGDFVANFDGRGIVRVDACGGIVWQNRDRAHHSIDVDDNGDLWAPITVDQYKEKRIAGYPFRFDAIGRFDANTGKMLETIDLVSSVLRSDKVGLLVTNRPIRHDMMHLNDVEVLRADRAAAFPMFKAGDLILSSRHYNQVWVIDGTDHNIKWFSAGPMIGQHDPDFQPDGTITIFDNQPGPRAAPENGYKGYRGGSRILSLDPSDGTYRTLYQSDDRNIFYTPFRGKHQVLKNGNILITETDAGRVFEVTPDGEVVWSFINKWDDTQVAWVMKATKYPESYAAFAKTGCPQ